MPSFASLSLGPFPLHLLPLRSLPSPILLFTYPAITRPFFRFTPCYPEQNQEEAVETLEALEDLKASSLGVEGSETEFVDLEVQCAPAVARNVAKAGVALGSGGLRDENGCFEHCGDLRAREASAVGNRIKRPGGVCRV